MGAVLGGVYGTGDVDILVTGQVATTGDNSSGVVAFVESGRGTGPGDGDIDVQVVTHERAAGSRRRLL